MKRRAFLVLSVLFAAAMFVPRKVFGFGQEPEKPKDQPEGKTEGDKQEEKDPYLETKFDSRGIPYRDCPECGGKMYKDDGKTWLCEACGYSYEE